MSEAFIRSTFVPCIVMMKTFQFLALVFLVSMELVEMKYVKGDSSSKGDSKDGGDSKKGSEKIGITSKPEGRLARSRTDLTVVET